MSLLALSTRPCSLYSLADTLPLGCIHRPSSSLVCERGVSWLFSHLRCRFRGSFDCRKFPAEIAASPRNQLQQYCYCIGHYGSLAGHWSGVESCSTNMNPLRRWRPSLATQYSLGWNSWPSRKSQAQRHRYRTQLSCHLILPRLLNLEEIPILHHHWSPPVGKNRPPLYRWFGNDAISLQSWGSRASFQW